MIGTTRLMNATDSIEAISSALKHNLCRDCGSGSIMPQPEDKISKYNIEILVVKMKHYLDEIDEELFNK